MKVTRYFNNEELYVMTFIEVTDTLYIIMIYFYFLEDCKYYPTELLLMFVKSNYSN